MYLGTCNKKIDSKQHRQMCSFFIIALINVWTEIYLKKSSNPTKLIIGRAICTRLANYSTCQDLFAKQGRRLGLQKCNAVGSVDSTTTNGARRRSPLRAGPTWREAAPVEDEECRGSRGPSRPTSGATVGLVMTLIYVGCNFRL